MGTLFIRQWHSYIGALIAPSVIFFALTGSLQLFSLHEAHGSYHPPPLIEELSSVHKDQIFRPGHHHGPPGAEQHAGPGMPLHAGDKDDEPALHTFLLKCFFLIVALGLATSSLLGIWINLTRARGRLVNVSLLAAGTVIPLILLLK